MSIAEIGPGLEDSEAAEQLEIQAKYSGYIERQSEEIERSRRYDDILLDPHLPYEDVMSLSNEIRQKLMDIRPRNDGSGITYSWHDTCGNFASFGLSEEEWYRLIHEKVENLG